MYEKVAVITGATSGIGLETAKDLAQKGYCVVMACRDTEKAAGLAGEIINKSGNEYVRVLPLDMASMQSIRSFSESFSAQYDKLHVLINNAGVFCDKLQKTEDGFEMTMGVNYLGTFLLTRLLLPVIMDTAEARIINIASKAALYGKLKIDEQVFSNKIYGFKAYSTSKLAQILFTIDLAEELKDSGVTVNAVSPGRVATNIWNGSSLLMKIVKPIMMRNSISAQEGARTGVYLAVSPMVEGITGKLFDKEKIMEYNQKCLDEGLRKELMKVSYDAVQFL
ncbi:SDR family oxidoreductase [Desulfitibacter alkalitolerans]|uniref:SDR family oxidoreductase n=1 Tax=Desulfitibacter alkalitolerans TaxID=264641 RepID=UPI0006847502|nr:SDR family oxidoreductase [Desulfitibacter alkalitolerans]